MKSQALGGGFIGPDIFFVLSGYLITGLLVKEFKRNINPRTGVGSVSIKAFYLRRARRILPAALFVIIAINLWAQFRLNVLQVSQIKADSVWTIFFGANITFLRQATDYFAQNNAVSPLQHYWSLSVEEQFYTVWPVLFLAALSFRTLAIRGRLVEWQTRLRTVFAVIGVASFAWLLFEFTNSPTTAYFSTFSRAWELALGGLLSMVSFSSVAERFRPQIRALRVISLVAVISAIGIVTPNNFGYTLVIPAVATGLLLLTGAHAKGDLVYRLLSSRVLNGLGAISFSLYLWHWPVFVFGRQEGWMDTLPQKVIGVVVCIVLGTVSYFLVEKTFLAIPLPKAKKQGPPKAREFSFAKSRVLTSLTTLAVVAALVGITYPSAYGSTSTATVASEDWIPPATAASFAPSVTQLVNPDNQVAADSWVQEIKNGLRLRRVPFGVRPNVAESKSVSQSGFYCPGKWQLNGAKVCERVSVGKEDRHLAYILGDSHAAMLWNAVTSALGENWTVILYAMPNCPNGSYERGVSSQDFKKCRKFQEDVNNIMSKAHPDLIFVSDNVDVGSRDVTTAELVQSDKRLYQRLLNFSKGIVRFAKSPQTPNLTLCLDVKNSMVECVPGEYNGSSASNVARQDVAQKHGVLWLDLATWMCLLGRCPAIIGNTIVTGDGNHLTPQFASLLGPKILVTLKQRFPQLF